MGAQTVPLSHTAVLLRLSLDSRPIFLSTPSVMNLLVTLGERGRGREEGREGGREGGSGRGGREE